MQGNAVAQYHLATISEFGLGIEEDYGTARKW